MMFGAKRRKLENNIHALKWEKFQLEQELNDIKTELEEMRISRRKWRDRASNLRRERRHLVQELKLQSQGQKQ